MKLSLTITKIVYAVLLVFFFTLPLCLWTVKYIDTLCTVILPAPGGGLMTSHEFNPDVIPVLIAVALLLAGNLLAVIKIFVNKLPLNLISAVTVTASALTFFLTVDINKFRITVMNWLRQVIDVRLSYGEVGGMLLSFLILLVLVTVGVFIAETLIGARLKSKL